MAIFISKPTPFLEEFFMTLKKLDYPLERFDLYLYNAIEKHEDIVEEVLREWKVRSVKRIRHDDEIGDQLARSLAV